MWFTASLFFKGVHVPVSLSESIWEHRVVLLNAENEEEALKKAINYGTMEEHSYSSVAGDSVNWKFDSVDRIQQLDVSEFRDGTELFSRFLRSSEVEGLKTPFDD